jgi:hypothetical protein
MKNCSIGSSEACIIETAADLHCKYSVNDFIRDVYGMKMDESRYNSIFHAINIESSGLIAHNYLDSLYCSTMEDGFMYNNISMWLPIDDAYFDVPWPNADQEGEPLEAFKFGSYFESGFNQYGPGFTRNTIRGWAINNVFSPTYTLNFQTNGAPGYDYQWPNAPTYLEGNTFGPSIANNYIWNAVNCEFHAYSINGINFEPLQAKLLNGQFNKVIRSSASYNGVRWEHTGTPILSFIDSDGNEQLQRINDSTTVIPFAGPTATPCPEF